MPEQPIDTLDRNFLSGHLCLEFANTVGWHASDHPRESLNSYTDLVGWAEESGLLTTEEGRQLRSQAEDYPPEAAAALRRAVDLRETIYRIWAAHAHRLEPDAGDLEAFNTALGQALSRLRLTRSSAGFGWAWAGDEPQLDAMLWPLAWSAAQLLTSELIDRVGQCADEEGCGWLFLDLTKNRSRRWCSINDCGNRAKVRRHRQRNRTDASDPVV